MFRKRAIPDDDISSSNVLLKLPVDSISTIFLFLSVTDLIKTKIVSSKIKKRIDDYINCSSFKIYYGVSLQCQISIGYKVSHANTIAREDVRRIWDFTQFPTSAADYYYINEVPYLKKGLLPRFNSFATQPDNLMYLFNSEYQAELFFQKNKVSLCKIKFIDIQNYYSGQAFMSVSPIYKVYLVHSVDDKIEEMKNDTEMQSNSKVKVSKASNLLPISASLKLGFFPPGSRKINKVPVLDNVSLNSSAKSCVLL